MRDGRGGGGRDKTRASYANPLNEALLYIIQGTVTESKGETDEGKGVANRVSGGTEE